VLIRYAGMTILTDPDFLHRGERIHLGYGLRATRLADPALCIDQLPPLDLVILSHLHEDHFDRVAERELERSLPILTTPDAATSLRRKGFDASEPLKTWESWSTRRGEVTLRVTALPGRHGPALISRLLPRVMGSFLEFTRGDAPLLRIYITGDTLVYSELGEIPRRCPDIDLALLHLGGTRILGILVTMDAQQGVEALRLIRPRMAIPIHYSDYDVFRSPLRDFQREVLRAELGDRVRYLLHGEAWQFEVPQERVRATGAVVRMVEGSRGRVIVPAPGELRGAVETGKRL
jgi:L-ascorbate metabolism protein UlaG (beta-lactamase superfamily)